MTRRVVHPLGVTCFLGLMLLGTGCRSTPPAGTGTLESRAQVATLVRDRGLELTTLRAELAAARIAAAKKEAELQELRDLVQQLRLENAESRQAFLELRDQAEQRQRDLEKMREVHARQTHTHTSEDLSVLKDMVVTLAQELSQLRQDLANPVAKERVKFSVLGLSESSESGPQAPRSDPPQRLRAARPQPSAASALSPMALTVTDALVPASPSTVTVQPGDTLAGLAKRHRTTVEILRGLNDLTGDTVIIGRELVLPTSRQP